MPHSSSAAGAEGDPAILRWGGWAMLLLGGPMALFGVYFAILANQSVSWPKTEGKVEQVRVRTHVSSGTGQTSTSSVRSYFPEIHYSYSVDGKAYESKRFSLGEGAKTHFERTDAVQAAAKYRALDSIDVYYDPSEPDSAVLQTGATTGSWVPLLLGLFFSGCGWFMLKRLSAISATQSER